VTHQGGRDVVTRPIQPGSFARTEHFDGPNQLHGQPGGVHGVQTQGQFVQTGHADDFNHNGRPVENSVVSPNGGISVQGGSLTTHGGAITTPGGAITTPGSAITTPGGAITTPGGAITTPGGAVRPVVPGLNRDTNMGNRGNGHNGVQNWQAPPVSSPAGAAVVTQTPAVERVPHSFERSTVRDTPGERMGAPAVTAPRQSVPSAPAVSMPMQRQSVPSAPAVSMPVERPSAPPVTAPRESSPATHSSPAVVHPQSSHMSAPAVHGGSAPAMHGGGSNSFASHSGGSSGSSHGSSGGGHSSGGHSGGGSSSGGHGKQ
jgi:hypothetical protein